MGEQFELRYADTMELVSPAVFPTEEAAREAARDVSALEQADRSVMVARWRSGPEPGDFRVATYRGGREVG